MNFLEAVKTEVGGNVAWSADSLQNQIDNLNAKLGALELGETLVIDNLSDEVYHGAQGISCSKIKLFMDCPRKYWAKYIANIMRPVERDYFDFGKAAHCIILEPDEFKSRYVCQPKEIKTRQGKVWAELKAEEETKGRVILKRDQWEDMPLVRDSIDADPIAKGLTSGGIAERSIFKRDEETGLIIKCRPDYTIDDLISDLKTGDSANPKLMDNKFKKLGYHVQDAMYSDISGCKAFVFVMIESARPFVVTAPVEMSSSMKRLGYLEYRKALLGIKECMESNLWPSYKAKGHVIKANKFDEYRLNQLEGNDNEQ